MKTVTIQLHTKDPDAWNEVIGQLEMPSKIYSKFLECCEYATIELTIAEDFSVVKARVVPVKP